MAGGSSWACSWKALPPSEFSIPDFGDQARTEPCSEERLIMNPQDAIDLTRHALCTALLLCSPVLAVGLVVGLVVGVLQALTQIQDQTLAFVPKLLAIVGTVAVCLPWLVDQMLTYSEELLTQIPKLVFGL